MNKIKLDGTDITPSKVVCVGRNYVDHIKELGNETPTEPVIFVKPNSAISSDIEASQADEIHYEGEICFLFKSGKLAGIGVGLDLTKRRVQQTLKEKGLPWERAKAFDKSAVFTEFVAASEELQHYRMELHINHHLKQVASCDLMIHKPAALIDDIQSFMTLEDGDILMTGTPKGVGVIHSGDTFTATLFHLGDIVIQQSWVAN